MANIVATNVSNGIVPFLVQESGVLTNLFPKMDHLSFVRKDYQDMSAGTKNQVIQIPKLGSFSASYKADNTPVTYSTPSDSPVSVTLNKRPYVAMGFEDTAKIFTNLDYAAMYLADSVKQVYQAAVSDTLALVPNYATPANFAGTVGTAGTAVTRAVIQSSRLQLNTKFAPEDDRVLFLAETSDDALLSDSTIYQAYSFGQAILPSGKLPELYGMQTYWSTLMPTVTGTPNTRYNWAMHKDAIAFVSRPLPMEPAGHGVETVIILHNGVYIRISMHYDGDAQATKFIVDALYGQTIIRPEFLCVIKS